MKTVFTVLSVDRHSDPSVRVFAKKDDAILYARTVARRAAQFCYDNSATERVYDPPSNLGWVFRAVYSGEGDSITVAQAEVHP
jgi:hypothetical protein